MYYHQPDARTSHTASNLPRKGPLITVGITCFNAAGTIARALDSAAAQDWPELEIVVVDDASGDESAAVVSRAAAADPRIRLVRHETNRGCAAARNTILRESAGAFVAFFDDDDVSAPQRLSVQHEMLTVHEAGHKGAMVACFTSGERRYSNGYAMPFSAIGSQPEVPRGSAVADYLLCNDRRPGVFYGGGTPTCSLMARRETFAAVGGFDEALRRQEDVDFAVRLAFHGAHFIGTPERLLTQYATASSDKAPEREHESFLRILEKNRDYLVAKGCYGYMRRWSALRLAHFKGQRLSAAAIFLTLALSHPLRTFRHARRSVAARLRHERKIHERTIDGA